MTIVEAFSLYAEEYIAFKGQSKRTEEHNNLTGRSLAKFTGNKNISKLTLQDVRGWKNHLEKTCTASTVRGYIVRLRVVLRYMNTIGIEALDVDLIPVPKRPDTNPVVINKDEVEKLIAVAPSLRSRAVISLLFCSGLRVSELCGLNRDDFDRRFSVVGKGGYVRVCFMDEDTYQMINAYLSTRKDNDQCLFRNKNLLRLNAGNVQLILREARKAAGFTKQITPHTLRHSYATHLLDKDIDVRSIQLLMGHRSLQTTMQYLHKSDPMLQKAHEAAFGYGTSVLTPVAG